MTQCCICCSTFLRYSFGASSEFRRTQQCISRVRVLRLGLINSLEGVLAYACHAKWMFVEAKLLPCLMFRKPALSSIFPTTRPAQNAVLRFADARRCMDFIYKFPSQVEKGKPVKRVVSRRGKPLALHPTALASFISVYPPNIDHKGILV